MKYWISTLLILTTQIAGAMSDDNIVIVSKKKTILEDSSEFNRMDKEFQITAQPIGVNPTELIGGGISVGYFLDLRICDKIT